MSGTGTADQVLLEDGTPTDGDSPWIDSLVSGGAWIDTPGLPSTGGPTTISYNYVQNQYMYGADGKIYLAGPWSNNAVTAAENALNAWEAVANIDFVRVSSSDDTDIRLWTVPSAAISDASGSSGTPGFSNNTYVNIFFNNSTYVGNQLWDWDFSGLRPGTYGYTTLVRELGRSLGLASPYTGGPAPDATLFPGVTDPSKRYGDYGFAQGIYSVMAGNGWQSQFPEHYPDNLTEYMYGWTATPMAFDIAAIQIIYGANTTYGTGNDTYLLPNGGFGTSWSCIWDAGGVDEITSAGYGSRCLIDLRAATLTAGEGGGGFVSYVAGVVGGFTIAYGVVIENATGGDADDTLIGNDANNVLTGNAGADTIFGGMGADTLNGGDGADTLNGGDDADMLNGGDGADFMDLGDGNDVAYAGDGRDTILGGLGNDVLVGSDDIYVIDNNFLSGGAGDDVLHFDAFDTVDGGAGRDFGYLVNDYAVRIDLGATSIEWFRAAFGGDSVNAASQSGSVEVYGMGGGDTIIGSSYADFLSAGSGNDSIDGGGGNDVILADSEMDTVNGGEGDDAIHADASDLVTGGNGRDALYITGGTGLSINLTTASFEFVADFASGSDTLNGSSSSANLEIYAAGGNDSISGGGGVDALWGEAGNDTITGGTGNDKLVGGAGSDRLIGGVGIDELFGSGGSGGDGAIDTFVFTSNWGTDFVFDFEVGRDRLDLSALGINFGALTLSNTADGHCYVNYGVNLIAVANMAGLITSSDFIF